MTLLAGDLTTPARVAVWMPNLTVPSAIISQLIGSMTGLIYGKLNRARTYSQTFTRTFDGVGNMQLVLPDYPVTSITTVQQGQVLIPPSSISQPTPVGATPGYGYRFIPWEGNLPGTNAVVEFVGGFFYTRAQNVRVTYNAGYLIAKEPGVVPVAKVGPYTITVLQPEGIWCRDGGVTYADGTPLTPVTTISMAGQYIPPSDATPGLYTFSGSDQAQPVLISYSFIPAPLEEACIQMIAERYSYRGRVGEISKSLGGQETMRFARGSMGRPWSGGSSLPPEVMDLIWDYISVLPPVIGAPV